MSWLANATSIILIIGPCPMFFVGALIADVRPSTIVNVLLSLIISTVIHLVAGTSASIRNARDVILLLQASNQVFEDVDINALISTLPEVLRSSVGFNTASTEFIRNLESHRVSAEAQI